MDQSPDGTTATLSLSYPNSKLPGGMNATLNNKEERLVIGRINTVSNETKTAT